MGPDRPGRQRGRLEAGNRVEVLVDGADVLPSSLRGAVLAAPDDWVHFTDWEGDPDERLDGPGTEWRTCWRTCARKRRARARSALAFAPRAGRTSPSSRTSRSRRASTRPVARSSSTSAVRRGGSHHQKLVVIRRRDGNDDDVAFVGGIDLCHGRHDDGRHLGDPQAVELDDRVRRPTALARRPARAPRPGGRGARRHLPGTLGGPAPARPPQPAPARGAHVHPPAAPPGSAAAAARGAGAVWAARGAGAAHLPGQAAGVPVRARRRAQRRPGVPQGAAGGPGASSTSRTSTSGRSAPPRPSPTRCAPTHSSRWSWSSPGTRTATGGVSGPGGAHRTGARHAHRRARWCATACSSATSRTKRARRSTSTPRSASSTTCG